MAKRLYEVEVSATMFVVADDEADAERVARDVVYCDPDDCGLEAYTCGMVGWDKACVPDEWRNALPFGAEEGDNRTVADWAQEMLEEEKAEELRKLQVTLPIEEA